MKCTATALYHTIGPGWNRMVRTVESLCINRVHGFWPGRSWKRIGNWSRDHLYYHCNQCQLFRCCKHDFTKAQAPRDCTAPSVEMALRNSENSTNLKSCAVWWRDGLVSHQLWIHVGLLCHDIDNGWRRTVVCSADRRIVSHMTPSINKW